MQDYLQIAEKNGTQLLDKGPCQFCGAYTRRGIHECVEIFSLGFQQIDYAQPANHIYRFMAVDAHTLQHPEIHGSWNNHFHLTRQHLMYHYKVIWNYQLSPQLSEVLNHYKKEREDEFLAPPPIGKRGLWNAKAVQDQSTTEKEAQTNIQKWGEEVYQTWAEHHTTIDTIAKSFMAKVFG